MTTIHDKVNTLVSNAEKYSRSSGRNSSGYKKMYMEEIRKVEKSARASRNTDEFIQSLKKHLTHKNASVRERVAYLIGELFLLNNSSKEVTITVKKLIECIKDPAIFYPITTSGRELVNALGKSRDPESEPYLLEKLYNNDTGSIRQNILVALGKVGGSETVKAISQLVKKENLSLQEKISILWALGKLGSVQNTSRSNFPLPRSIFKDVLIDINKLIKGSVKHPNIHYCAIYAVGEICDQRDTTGLTESFETQQIQLIESTILEITEKRRGEILNSIKSVNKFRNKAEIHAKNLTDLSEKVTLKMIRGQKLDADGEKILFAVRILFDLMAPPDVESQLQDPLNLSNQYPKIEDSSQGEVQKISFLEENGDSRLHSDTTVTQPNTISTTESALPIPTQQDANQNAKKTIQSKKISESVLDFTFFLESLSEVEEEIEFQLNLRKTFKTRQRTLEIDAAAKGFNTPPEVKNELIDINKKITEIEEKIIKLKNKKDEITEKG